MEKLVYTLNKYMLGVCHHVLFCCHATCNNKLNSVRITCFIHSSLRDFLLFHSVLRLGVLF